MPFKEYAKYYDVIYKKKNYILETNYILKILRIFVNRKFFNILEVGCGSGSHANIFFKKGHNITGIDSSIDMINLAKKKYPQIKFYHQNAKNIKIKKKFNLIVLNFHVINFLSNKSLGNFFKSCVRLLKKNGFLIFDCVSKYATFYYKPKKKTVFYKDKINNIEIKRITTPKIIKKKSIFQIKFDIIVKKPKKIKFFKETHILYLYSLNDFIKKSGIELKYISSFKYLTKKKYNEFRHWNGLCVFKKK